MNGDDFSLSVTRVGDGTPHLGSGAQLRTNERPLDRTVDSWDSLDDDITVEVT